MSATQDVLEDEIYEKTSNTSNFKILCFDNTVLNKHVKIIQLLSCKVSSMMNKFCDEQTDGDAPNRDKLWVLTMPLRRGWG